MAWWQKKLLRYALSRTGLLDDRALDLDNSDISIGRQNVVELKNVGLNIARISKLAQLPPDVRVETARILTLRLTVPADIYQSSIIAEADGVELNVKLEEKDADQESTKRRAGGRARSPATARSPEHRKVHQRLHSPPPYDPGGAAGFGEVHMPTTEQLAKSFLLDEPAQERRQLEAAVNAKAMEESFASESSGSDALGTGAGVGLPGFLAGFLQGIVDRLQVRVRNVVITIETQLDRDLEQPLPVALRLRVGAADLETTGSDRDGDGRRKVNFSDISMELVSDASVFDELSEPSSPIMSRRSGAASPLAQATPASSARKDSTPINSRDEPIDSSDGSPTSIRSPGIMQASVATADIDRFADVGDEPDFSPSIEASRAELDIKPGDDNISWGSRRSKSSAPAEDLWKSMASVDDLPESLLLERTSTQRAHSSGGVSPNFARTRCPVSPHGRSLQSPGSWPTLTEHTERNYLQPSPGSWPRLDESQQSIFQPLVPAHKVSQDNTTESQLLAEGRSLLDEAIPENQDTSLDDPPEDLTTSRVFSSEETRSMYMSAMSYTPQMHMPGGWGSDDTASEISFPPGVPEQSSPVHLKPVATDRLRHPSKQPSAWEDDLAYGDKPYSTPKAPLSGNVTPRAPPPEPAKPSAILPDPGCHASKPLVYIDKVSLLLPTDSTPAEQLEQHTTPPKTSFRGSTGHDMPGTFSAYSEMAASRGKLDSSVRVSRYEATAPSPSTASPIGLEVGSIKCQIDLSCGRLLYQLVTTCLTISERAKSSKPNQIVPGGEDAGNSSVALSLTMEQFSLALKDAMDDSLQLQKETRDVIESIASLQCDLLDFSKSAGDSEIRIGSLKALVGTSCLLSFDKSLYQNTSMVLNDGTPDLAVTMASRYSVTRRPITELSVETLPLKVLVDLPVIDGAFESFGGLSGVLELGNSILSESGFGSSPASPVKSTKGVRFEGQPESVSGLEFKLNARIGGVLATLQGSACNVVLRTSTVKTVYREHGVIATVEQVQASGPHQPNGESAPVTADLSTSRLEYLVSPQDKDLERLLSLLTPSKDKYDTEDDILLDTLLRQRRKGAVVRLSVGGAKLKCLDWTCLTALEGLGAELSRLSAVTKYLPEDDRPGVLVLVRLKDVEARLPVNDRFGMLHIRLTDLHCAQVGLPALLALSIGSIRASQAREVELVHPLVSSAEADNLPMLMARTLGDEVEPVVKVKLFNLAFEYSVLVLLDLTGMDQQVDTEELVAELAKSVVDLTQSRGKRPVTDKKEASGSAKATKKSMKLDLLVHESAVGLSPEKLSSKGLLVLSDAKFSTTIPPEETLTATLELRKAGLFLADRPVADDAGAVIPSRGAPSNTAVKAQLTSALSKQGYVSVGSVMSAQVVVCVADVPEGSAKSVDVDVKTELLLLETCADSTQTLMATMSGLAPPTPPSKQPKYQTEPLAIEDMMASFTGDAYAKPEQRPQTLFDVDEEPEDEPDMMFDMPPFDADDDGLLSESETTSSLYGPVSGMLRGVDKPEDDDDPENFPETAASLLEDDPFEMTLSPTDAPLGDAALLRDLKKQSKPTLHDEMVDLGVYEIEDLGFDALGGNQSALGTRYRFNTPATAGRDKTQSSSPKALPFRLRVRDLHAIWNIYDGYDWQRTRDGITEAVEQVEQRAEQRKAKRRQSQLQTEDEESVIGDFLFNSIYIGVPSNQDAQELRRQINRHIDDMASETESVPMSGMSRPSTYSASGRTRPRRRLKLERSRAHKVAFELKGVSADVLVFPPGDTDMVSSIDVRVKDFEIFDNVPTSTWRKFLTHLDDGPYGREMAKPMLHINISNLRTLENFAASELAMHVSVLPLRLHVDQDALDFITRFFEFKDEAAAPPGPAGDQPFLQRVEIETVDLRLDYKPKKVDYVGLRSGHTNEFMNFIILDAANIRLKHAIIYGIKGFEPLHKTLNDIWMPDVKRNQLPTVLAGLAPVRSLVNIGTGVRDVVAIPIREYRKDGRIVRSIQKGAFHFGKTTASELARLGAKVAIGTQNLLQGAEGLLTPDSASPSGRPSSGRRSLSDHGWQDVNDDEDESERRAISSYANQPLSVFGGLRSAQRYLEHDLLTARDALIAVQGEILESSSPGSAMAAVARHAPTVILRPIIGTSRAVGTALMGVGNAIDRDNVRRVDDKYKRR
ncbi:autophagy-related protein 2 [Extremus antarcticus]|uniref:Autophagy-related protein 2 n=1 Tax=Extremus antarcticus TaxID=702011 RepID=A0AAJ0DGD3_9PEZI|nr:autophagy-related protein 2 [Extremus antarcticus]